MYINGTVYPAYHSFFSRISIDAVFDVSTVKQRTQKFLSKYDRVELFKCNLYHCILELQK